MRVWRSYAKVRPSKFENESFAELLSLERIKDLRKFTIYEVSDVEYNEYYFIILREDVSKDALICITCHDKYEMNGLLMLYKKKTLLN